MTKFTDKQLKAAYDAAFIAYNDAYHACEAAKSAMLKARKQKLDAAKVLKVCADAYADAAGWIADYDEPSLANQHE